jgi:hypothetical protein
MTGVLTTGWGAIAAEGEERVVFADTFQAPQLSPEWQAVEGEWKIADGALTCRDGGLIVLNTPPGGRFTLEFEIAFPSNWMSVILFYTGPKDYGTLYLGGGYWESFEMLNEEIADYVQRRDPEIVRSGEFQRIKVTCEYSLVSFSYDGKKKGPATLTFRPGAKVAFRSLPKSGLLRIRNFRLSQLVGHGDRVSYEAPVSAWTKGVVYQDRDFAGSPAGQERLRVDARSGTAELTYQFEASRLFESCFVRLPVAAARGDTLLLDVEGDGSGNGLFVVVHDASGEQHLATATGLAWAGWQKAGVNLKTFLESPGNMERLAIHWGGDGNQKINFPIKALDIGVVKRGSRIADRGQLRFRNVRFMDSRAVTNGP